MSLRATSLAVAALLALTVLTGHGGMAPAAAAWRGNNGRIAMLRDAEKGFSGSLGGQIVSRTIDDPATTQLVDMLAYSPTYSPDGTKIAFARHSEENYQRYSWDIWVMDADGSNQQNVTRSESEYTSVSFTANGRRLLFTEGYDEPRMHTINLDGTNKRAFAPRVKDVMAQGVVSPNGKKVAYVARGSLRTIGSGGDPASVTVMEPRVTGGVHDPEWSPGGGYIVFARAWFDPYKVTLHTVKHDRSRHNKIADFGPGTRVAEPAWSPDGTRILYSRSGRRGKWLWASNPNGSNKTKVDIGGYDPSWQPLP